MASIEVAEDPYSLIGINNIHKGCLFLLVNCSDSLASAVKVLNLRDDCSDTVFLKVQHERWFRPVEHGGILDTDLEALTCAIENTTKNLSHVEVLAVTNDEEVRGSVLRLLTTIGSIPTLKEIEWHGGWRIGRHTTNYLTGILQRAKNLRKLKCRSIRFDGTPEELQTFGLAIAGQSSLETVYFSKCTMDDSNAQVVLKAAQQLPWLVRLTLSFGCKFVELFAEKRLISLDISELGGQGLIALNPLLKPTSKIADLKYLTVGTTLLEEECNVLAEIVRINKGGDGWLKIDVGPFVDDKHLAILVNALKDNSSFGRVTFSFGVINNKFGFSEHIQKLFVSILETNCTLESMSLGNMEPSLESKMKFYLKLNTLGRKKLLQDTMAPKEQWIRALDLAKDDISCLYYFLSANPSLCEIETNAASRKPCKATAAFDAPQQKKETKKTHKIEVPVKPSMVLRKRKRTPEPPSHRMRLRSNGRP